MAREGVEGRMFPPMAITVALALAGAMAFTLTAFPALAAYVLSAPRPAHDENKGLFARARRLYARVLDWTLGRPKTALGLAALTLAGALLVTRTGRAEVATDPVGPDETEVMVKLRPKKEWTTAHDLDDLGEHIKTAVEGEVPATFVSVSQPIEDRVNQLLAGSRADVVIKVFGEDLAVLKA